MQIKLLILILLLLPIVYANDASDIQIVLSNYTPQPVTPSNIFNIEFKVKNLVNEQLTDLVFDLNSNKYFSVDTDEIKFSTLGPFEEKTLIYSVEVKNDATTGFKKIDLDYEVNDDEETASFNIQVKSIETTLIVTSVDSIPNKIQPGQEAQVKINVKNQANFLLKDITLKLDLTSNTLPFAPIKSVTEQRIDSLSESQETQFTFDIISLPSAKPDIYKIPIKITYYDQFNQFYTKDDVIALIVSSTPSLDINIEKSELIESKKETLSINLVNRGLSNIKLLNVEILNSNQFNLLSSKNIYIGNLDSDDSEIIDLDLIPIKKNSVTIPLSITYKDTNNQDYSIQENIEAKVYSVNEAKQIGLIKPNGFLRVMAFLVIIVFIYIIYRRRKKKNA